MIASKIEKRITENNDESNDNKDYDGQDFDDGEPIFSFTVRFHSEQIECKQDQDNDNDECTGRNIREPIS